MRNFDYACVFEAFPDNSLQVAPAEDVTRPSGLNNPTPLISVRAAKEPSGLEAVKLVGSHDTRSVGQERGMRARPCSPRFELSSHVEDIKRVHVACPETTPPFFHFPTRGLSRFRERLAKKMALYEDDPSSFTTDRLTYASEKLVQLVMSGELTHRCPVPDDGPLDPSPDLNQGGDETTKRKQNNSFQCANGKSNNRKARRIVKLLRADQHLKVVKDPSGGLKRLPKHIECGSLRTSVRSMFAPGLSPVQELSIKTTQKAEGKPCRRCSTLLEGRYLMAYKKARLSPQVCDDRHLQLFTEAFSRNVPSGWDKRKSPYVPNGHATRQYTRSQGGNWQQEPFSTEPRVELVWSSGKPRVVTLYSSRNVEVLTPLHNSLYSFLKGRNWLLVGSPTSEKLRRLREGTRGAEWQSFDYEAATDNIKTMYVRRMVEVLIEKSDDLSVEEVDCLRVLSELSLGGSVAESGQPMGSPMSFPLLCLVNKTVFDMSLTDLFLEGKISFREWSEHRCLINGDDLLTRSTSEGDLVSAVRLNGGAVGLRVNEAKTMVSSRWAEINSTVFEDASTGVEGEEFTIEERKKTNVSALWMDAGVNDVVGYSCESAATAKGISAIVKNNKSRLARQKIKTYSRPGPVVLSALLRSKAIRIAISSQPDFDVPEAPNPFAMEVEPDGFNVTRAEVFEVVTSEVTKVRERGKWKELFGILRNLKLQRKRNTASQVGSADRKTAKLILQTKPPRAERRMQMRCLTRYWVKKRKEEILAGDEVFIPAPSEVIVFDGESCSPFTQIQSLLKEFKIKNARSPLPAFGSPRVCIEGDYIKLSADEGEVRFSE